MKVRKQSSHFMTALSVGGLLFFTSSARAQNDINRPPPNLMLLVDSSGSMEYKSSGQSLPVCFPAESDTAQHERSRWIELVEVLTGTIQDYSCWAQDRSTTDFHDEFEIDNVDPYDSNGRYSLPYNRPQSNLCTPGPGVVPPTNAPYSYPSGAIAYRPYSTSSNDVDTSSTCSSFTQSNDGLLDSLNQRIRFGLMTFDTHPDEGTGLSAGSADYTTGFDGTWSYFLDSKTCSVVGDPILTSYCAGTPAGCTTGPFAMEVGARNAAAPPWEGRMIAFGPSNADGTELARRNEWIQEVLLSTRPYGATPIAGLLADARDFFWNDTSQDPLDTTAPYDDFGPRNDPLLGPMCRRNSMILLSDGEPNLDMRPSCDAETGICPYQEPGEIADELVRDTSDRAVRTYVIGFAVGEVDPDGDGNFTDCEDLAETDYCENAAYSGNKQLQACCTLNEIALNGTPPDKRGQPDVIDHALYADNPTELRAALSRIFSEELAAVTGRTMPVFTSSTGAGSGGSLAFQFTSAVNVKTIGLWEGVLRRQRFSCNEDNEPVEEDFSESAGDDFIANVHANLDARRFYTVVAEDAGTGERFSPRSIRPHIDNDDGLGTYSGVSVEHVTAANLVGELDEALLDIAATKCQDVGAAACAERIMNWLVGIDDGADYDRCPDTGECSLIADIFHSTPQVRGRPEEALRDESYTNFAAGLIERDTVLYTSSNDGFLHAFRVAPGSPDEDAITTKTNNEMWAFLPPGVMWNIQSMYPNAHQPLLDGKPVIKDVVASTISSGIVGNYPYVFQRTRAQAEGGLGSWRTILVQNFGSMRGGYFALDITQPEYSATNPTDTGPKFLWQLTQDASGNEVFGNGTAAPLITTVFASLDSNDPVEIPVAVLPGGTAGSPGASTCAAGPLLEADPSDYDAATTVRCYDASSAPARSLTVVRLDTGEVIRSFRPSLDDLAQPSSLSEDLIIPTVIPAPIVGEPAAYPAQTGMIADRIFVGDQEGRLWRVDISPTDPDDWTMEVFFDAYSNPVGSPVRQPVVTPPILSVDDTGRITVNFSTGDQEIFTETAGMENYVYSLTEVFEDDDVKAKVNWRHVFSDGEVVAGPMTLFDRRLFFSTFQPASGQCEAGESTVYGVNYVEPKNDADLSEGGLPALPETDAVDATLVQNRSPVDGVVFGVGIRQLPTCTQQAQDYAGDPLLGYGTISNTTFAQPGQFQLVIQVGGVSASGSGRNVVTQTVDLPSPREPVSINTWAPILE